MKRGSRGKPIPALAISLLAAIALLALPATSLGAAPELFWQVPGNSTLAGSGAGEFNSPTGIATAQTTGHIFVADSSNARIVELDPWGQFVKAWGWGVDTGAAAFESCTEASGCQKGIPGAGAGQFSYPSGVAVDSDGNVYVLESEHEAALFGERSIRVQKFSPSGEFLLMFGGDVNKTTGENICTNADIEGGDVCGSGSLGSGPGEFEALVPGARIAIGPEGHAFVGDVGRIEEFDPTGAFVGDITGALAGEEVRALAMDSAGFFYVALTGKENVRKLDASGTQVGEFPAIRPRAITVGTAGDVYIALRPAEVPGKEDRIIEYSASGEKLIPDQKEEEEEANFAETGFLILGLATNSSCGIDGEDLLVPGVENFHAPPQSTVSAFGPPPDPALCPPPVVPPTIVDQFPSEVSPEAATVKAKINPHFWPDTTYFVEYGTGKCTEGGCGSKTPEELLTTKVVDLTLTTKGIPLDGLLPSTTYHFRFVAKSGGGGPVEGVGGAEGTFTTPSTDDSGSGGSCPNAAVRTGLSALLQDCRAYELVSPIDKNSGDILALANINGNPAAFDQAAEDGSRLGYSTYRAYGDAASAPYISQYLASRSSTGWTTDGISPPRGLSVLSANGLEVQYRLFSPDLCRGWLLHDSEATLAEGAVEGFANFYRQSNCGEEPRYSAITTAHPTCTEAFAYVPELQGVSPDGDHAVFRVSDKLTANAANCVPGANNKKQCYESFNGSLRLVSVLPSGTANGGDCSVGMGGVFPIRFDRLEGAFSNDGSRVYWTNQDFGPGTIYIRVNATTAQSKVVGGECTEAAKACTLEVGKGSFWTATPDGSKAYFVTSAGDLQEYDLVSKSTTKIAGEVAGLAGSSKDASRLYFVSKEDLASGAQAGQPNLYFYEAGGSPLFVATLAAADVDLKEHEANIPSLVNPTPFQHPARVTPDGLHIVFMSTRSLTGAPNLDANSGEPDAEVFVYDRTAEELVCASCASTGVRPSGRELRTQASLSGGNPSGIWAASLIPGSPNSLYASRPLSANGKRLFFESYQPLVLRDKNGKQDVYEWEAPGEGTCTEASTAYRPVNLGCISLISSGESPKDVEFIDAGLDGRDVFFTTISSLVPQDPGLIDIYDARAEGGFPAPPAPPADCQGEACQNPTPGPSDSPPASNGTGSGNVHEAKKPCPKGKVRRHGKCVKKHKKHRKGHHRGGSRK